MMMTIRSSYIIKAILLILLVVAMVFFMVAIFTRIKSSSDDREGYVASRVVPMDGIVVNVIPEWYDDVHGAVDPKGVMKDESQKVFRENIDGSLATKRCTVDGHDLPEEWHSHKDKDKCVVDLSNLAVRNQCSDGNSTLYDPKVIEDVYIDPNTKKCVVRFKKDADVGKYQKRIDIVAPLLVRIKENMSKTRALNEDVKGLRKEVDHEKARVGVMVAFRDHHKRVMDDLRRRRNALRREVHLCNAQNITLSDYGRLGRDRMYYWRGYVFKTGRGYRRVTHLMSSVSPRGNHPDFAVALYKMASGNRVGDVVHYKYKNSPGGRHDETDVGQVMLQPYTSYFLAQGHLGRISVRYSGRHMTVDSYDARELVSNHTPFLSGWSSYAYSTGRAGYVYGNVGKKLNKTSVKPDLGLRFT